MCPSARFCSNRWPAPGGGPGRWPSSWSASPSSPPGAAFLRLPEIRPRVSTCRKSSIKPRPPSTGPIATPRDLGGTLPEPPEHALLGRLYHLDHSVWCRTAPPPLSMLTLEMHRSVVC